MPGGRLRWLEVPEDDPRIPYVTWNENGVSAHLGMSIHAIAWDEIAAVYGFAEWDGQSRRVIVAIGPYEAWPSELPRCVQFDDEMSGFAEVLEAMAQRLDRFNPHKLRSFDRAIEGNPKVLWVRLVEERSNVNVAIAEGDAATEPEQVQPISISYSIPRNGWGGCGITVGERVAEFGTTWMGDPLGQLGAAAVALLSEATAMTLSIFQEPGETRIELVMEPTVVHHGAGCKSLSTRLRIRVRQYREMVGWGKDDPGELYLDALVDLVGFAEAVVKAMRDVQAALTPDQYLEEWEMPFPSGVLTHLEALLKARQGNE